MRPITHRAHILPITTPAFSSIDASGGYGRGTMDHL